MLRAVVILAGIGGEVAGWRAVVRGRGSIWRVLIPIYCVSALAALALRSTEMSGRWAVAPALGAGAASGVLLYLGTIAFVALASRWQKFRAAVADDYSNADGLPLASALLLSAAVAAPAEEIFWRGLALNTIRQHVSVVVASAVVWFAYVAVKASGQSIPLLAGAMVGGAIWTVLAAWSGGLVAPIASHALWTGLMVWFPPPQAKGAPA